MYDKVGQVKKKGLTWVFDMWERSAVYEPGAATWRVELQFGRSLLHARGIETLDDLEREIPALWGYGMGWYSFRVPSKTDSNKSRWAVAGWWQDLSTWGGLATPALPRVKVVRPRLRRLSAGLVGYLTAVMAITEINDPGGAVAAALDMVCAEKVPLAFEDGGLQSRRLGTHILEGKLAAKRLRYEGFTMGAV
jgi:hypothetical protein